MNAISRFVFGGAFCGLLGVSALAQTPSPAPSPSPTPAPTPYALASVITEADATTSQIATIQNGTGEDALTGDLQKFIPKITEEITNRSERTAKELRGPAKIGSLQDLVTGWKVLQEDLAFHSRQLNEKLVSLDLDNQKVTELSGLWKLTAQAAKSAQAPADILARITDIVQQLTATAKAITAKRSALLSWQSQLADQNTRITQILAQVELARGEAVDQLAVRDSLPLWEILRSAKTQAPAALREATLGTQFAETKVFLSREMGTVALVLALAVAFVVFFHQVRKRAARWVENDPQLRRSVEIFDVPVSTGTLLALCLAYFLLPGAPPLLDAILGVLLLIPLMGIMRRLIQPPLLFVTKALAVLYLVSQFREATSPFPLVHRLIYLAEILGGILFTLWLIKASRFADKPERGRTLMWKAVRAGTRAGLLVFVVSGTANVLGYVNFSLFIGTVALNCAYLALLLYAATQIAIGLISFFLKVPPISLLALVRNHHALLIRRAAWLLRCLAFLLWIILALDESTLLQGVSNGVSQVLTAPLFANITLGNILAFLLTIWASFLISRFVRFALEEDVYLRVRLKPGLPFAISTLLHYAILLLGFYLAMAALIGDISKFTILAGAFGVGIGFGLQNIVNNFVSSLIVLFERPVKIGDQVEIGGLQGTVRQIGIRATIIRTSAGSEIIIPNGKLISDPVTNWNLTHHQRLLMLEIATASAGVDPARVVELLEKAAAAVKDINPTPPPQAVLTKLAAASFTFELRVWTPEPASQGRIRSNLTIAINQTLAEQQIPLA